MLRVVLFLSWVLATTGWADMRIEGTHSDGMGGGLNQHVIYLRDGQMRIDRLAALQQGMANTDSVASSLLIRLSGSPAGVLFLDHGAKSVAMLSSLPAMVATPDSANQDFRVDRRAETREILGHQAQRHDFSFSGDVDPLALLGQQLPPGMAGLVSIRLNVTGTSWVVPEIGGADELADFFAQLTSRHLAIGMAGQNPPPAEPPLSLVTPGLSHALTGVMEHITRQGLPMLTQTRSYLEVDMEGALADMIRGLLDTLGLAGPRSTESMVTGVHTTNLPADLFYNERLPAGYTL